MGRMLRAAVLALAGVVTATAVAVTAAGEGAVGAAVFNDRGELVRPEGWRDWVFIGAPLTPNGLNGGQAAFPEFHHVYVNPDAMAVYRRTGRFPEGTVIAKELVLLQQGGNADGSTVSPSGRGYFAGAFNGMDVMVKDSARFADTGGWGFFNFGHHAPPYAATATAAPAASCAGCHQASARKDMVFTQFYPELR